MLKVMLSALCVLAAASPLSAAITAADIAGRWQGESYARDTGGPLTLDIVACGSGWCGVKVEVGDKCGGTALRIDSGTAEAGSDYIQFKGTLELAPGTEPYVVQTSLFVPAPDTPSGAQLTMQITGDTGGEFRAYRRSFPFEAQMVRIKDPVCHAPQTVSSLQ
jgi:hypothetical protein